MENNETFVTEQVTENVEVTTEQTPKTFTQEQVDMMVKEKLDQVLPGKIARREAKIRKEYDRKYGQLEEVLKAGTGKQNVEEITESFSQFYQKKGIQLPKKPSYTDADIEVLAKAEANEIISAGYDEVVEEVDRLANLGAENMTPREKAVFRTLAQHRKDAEQSRELSKIGVTEDVYSSKEFKDFQKMFTSTTPIKDVYDIYRKTQPQKEYRTMGSMKNTDSTDSGVKDFYTPEEARRFTKKDYDSNPALFAAVEKSMLKWRR